MDPEWEKKNKKTPFHVSMICSHTMMYGLREVGGTVRETQHGRLDAEGPGHYLSTTSHGPTLNERC